MKEEKPNENSYKIVTKKMTFNEFMESRSKTTNPISSHTILIYDPTDGFDSEVLEDLIWHFEDREEYEKCAELKKILDVQL